MSILRKIYNKLYQKKIVVKAHVVVSDPSNRLQGKRIVVTGGTGGIGLAMARRFVAEGAKVLIAGRNEKKLDTISNELCCEALHLDVTCVGTFENFISSAIRILGGIDCLVNNAGVSLHEQFQTVTPEGFDKQVATNLRGPFFLSQKVLAYMSENKINGQVLFISSETGETVDIRPYGLTKAAVNSLVQGLAYLYAKDGIRVNALSPGVTATGMTGFSADNLYCSYNTNGRAYLPEEIAEAATFLLSDSSGCVSGQILVCNNARTVNARWK